MSPADGTSFHAPLAWLDGRWQRDVLMQAGVDGHWTALTAGQAAPPQAVRLVPSSTPNAIVLKFFMLPISCRFFYF